MKRKPEENIKNKNSKKRQKVRPKMDTFDFYIIIITIVSLIIVFVSTFIYWATR